MEVTDKVLCRRKHRLPICHIRRVGRQLTDAVKECREVGADALRGIGEETLHLLQRVVLRLRTSLLLILIRNLELQDLITNALNLLQHHTVSVGDITFHGRIGLRKDGDLPTVARSVLIGDVIGSGVQSSLISVKGLRRDPH